ncbi:MAG: MerR family transcriptional regulator [Saprospiraceae bacterium]|jgi:DNA-binding transcriptional MerR regulator|nr:MerR family transcriptional regulator [Saprospiraceae bacterium]
MSILVKTLYDEPKRYYSIGEVAAMFEVSQSLLRFWETEFPSIKLTKNRKGDRLYTEKNISQLRLIYHLVKEKGYTLEGARHELTNQKGKEEKKRQILNDLIDTKTKLKKLLEDL